MQCPRCQHDNLADAAFCQECGARLEVVCAGCGTGNQPTAKFCRKCGQRLGPGRTGEAGSGFSSPQAYTPKHLAEKILTSRSAVEGERKQVTVLFADLKGSMELLADRDPEEARKILDPVLERMIEAVHHYEGTVNQVMGDGIMALFIESMRGGSCWDASSHLHLGEAYARLGLRDQASAAAERALLVARERGNRGEEAESLRVLGELALHADPPGIDTARGHYRQSLALAEELAMRPLAALCHLGLAGLHRQAGRRHEADESLARAATMFREMNMRVWLAQAETQRKEWSG